MALSALSAIVPVTSTVWPTWSLSLVLGVPTSFSAPGVTGGAAGATVPDVPTALSSFHLRSDSWYDSARVAGLETPGHRERSLRHPWPPASAGCAGGVVWADTPTANSRGDESSGRYLLHFGYPPWIVSSARRALFVRRSLDPAGPCNWWSTLPSDAVQCRRRATALADQAIGASRGRHRARSVELERAQRLWTSFDWHTLRERVAHFDPPGHHRAGDADIDIRRWATIEVQRESGGTGRRAGLRIR